MNDTHVTALRTIARMLVIIGVCTASLVAESYRFYNIATNVRARVYTVAYLPAAAGYGPIAVDENNVAYFPVVLPETRTPHLFRRAGNTVESVTPIDVRENTGFDIQLFLQEDAGLFHTLYIDREKNALVYANNPKGHFIRREVERIPFERYRMPSFLLHERKEEVFYINNNGRVTRVTRTNTRYHAQPLFPSRRCLAYQALRFHNEVRLLVLTENHALFMAKHGTNARLTFGTNGIATNVSSFKAAYTRDDVLDVVATGTRKGSLSYITYLETNFATTIITNGADTITSVQMVHDRFGTPTILYATAGGGLYLAVSGNMIPGRFAVIDLSRLGAVRGNVFLALFRSERYALLFYDERDGALKFAEVRTS